MCPCWVHFWCIWNMKPKFWIFTLTCDHYFLAGRWLIHGNAWSVLSLHVHWYPQNGQQIGKIFNKLSCGCFFWTVHPTYKWIRKVRPERVETILVLPWIAGHTSDAFSWKNDKFEVTDRFEEVVKCTEQRHENPWNFLSTFHNFLQNFHLFA